MIEQVSAPCGKQAEPILGFRKPVGACRITTDVIRRVLKYYGIQYTSQYLFGGSQHLNLLAVDPEPTLVG